MPSDKWDLSRLSSGERSALKRCAGVMMGSSMQAQQAFYHALTGHCARSNESAWFACMCMECLWHVEEHPARRPLEDMLGRIYRDPDATESTRKRCTAFMDLNWGDDGFLLGKLCSLVRKMRADDGSVMPDFEALADDLCRWNHTDHNIQRRWMRVICLPKNDENEEETHDAD